MQEEHLPASVFHPVVSGGISSEQSSDDSGKGGKSTAEAESELEKMFNDILDVKLSQLGLKVKIRPVEIGYEIRCITPHAYDLVYCTELGMGVYKLFKQGITGCMVYLDLNGNIKSLYLKDMQDPATGKIPPRGVNIHQDKVNMIFEYIMHYITPADYEAAKKYVPDPEKYDFKKILNW